MRVRFSKEKFDDWLSAARGTGQMFFYNPPRDELLTVAAACIYRYVNDAPYPSDNRMGLTKELSSEAERDFQQQLANKSGMALLQIMRLYEILETDGELIEEFKDGQSDFCVEFDGEKYNIRQATEDDG